MPALTYFLSRSVDQVWHGQLCGDTHFIYPSELEGNRSPTLNAVEALNNPRNIFLINTNINVCCLFFYEISCLNLKSLVGKQQTNLLHSYQLKI